MFHHVATAALVPVVRLVGQPHFQDDASGLISCNTLAGNHQVVLTGSLIPSAAYGSPQLMEHDNSMDMSDNFHGSLNCQIKFLPFKDLVTYL